MSTASEAAAAAMVGPCFTMAEAPAITKPKKHSGV